MLVQSIDIFEAEVIHVQDCLCLNHSTDAVSLDNWLNFTLPSLKCTSLPIHSNCVALLHSAFIHVKGLLAPDGGSVI